MLAVVPGGELLGDAAKLARGGEKAVTVVNDVEKIQKVATDLEKAGQAASKGERAASGAERATSVGDRAKALQSQLPAGSRGRVTMGAGTGEDASGKIRTVIGTSEPNGYLRPGVGLADGEDLATGMGHAETSILITCKPTESSL